MICEECKKEGKKSSIAVRPGYTTAMATHHFFDEDGVEHFHNPNRTTISYRCSNGHEWAVSKKNECRGCKK